MAIFKEALNPFGEVFGDMSNSGRNNTYANAVMFNAMSNRLAEGRNIAAANNLSYGGVDDNGEHIFAPAGVYQPTRAQEAAQGIAGLLDVGPPPIDPNLEMIGGPLPGTNLGGPLPGPPSLPNFDFDYPDPAPPTNSQVTDPYFQQPIIDDPFQYAQPDTRIPDVQEGPPIFYEDPIIPDPPKVVQGEIPTPGFEATEDPRFNEGLVEVSEGVGQPTAVDPNDPDIGLMSNTTTTPGIGTDNPFYAGATNVAQPPSMTPIAPSFSLDVGVGGYGTPANTAGFSNYDVGNIGGFGGFNLLSTLTPPEPTPTIATTAAPQTTTTALPTVNSFAGFNGFGGFGGF